QTKVKLTKYLPSSMQDAMEFEKSLSKSLYLVIDTETAPRRDFVPMRTEIIELGWAFVLDGSIIEKGSSLIKPAYSIPPNVSEALGITNEMVRNSPDFLEVFTPLNKRAGDATLVGHNIKYDIGVIIEVCERRLGQEAGSFLANLRSVGVIDTMKLFSRLFPHENGRRLKDLLKVLEIEETEKRHRAGVDATYTARALIKMLSILKEKGIEDADSLDHFIRTGNTFYQRPLI
ncbi:MAG: 3'-5' exonuclease, partial [Candidatus Bathyarchaeia archaeon]